MGPLEVWAMGMVDLLSPLQNCLCLRPVRQPWACLEATRKTELTYLTWALGLISQYMLSAAKI